MTPLGHGSLLGAFGNFEDTSPTQRGIRVRTRLMCEDVRRPPPNVEMPECIIKRSASVGGDLHEVGHNRDPNNRGQIPNAGLHQWHISHCAYLIDKLRNTPEARGAVLDNGVFICTPEAGYRGSRPGDVSI
jgi:hypothetical protein